MQPRRHHLVGAEPSAGSLPLHANAPACVRRARAGAAAFLRLPSGRLRRRPRGCGRALFVVHEQFSARARRGELRRRRRARPASRRRLSLRLVPRDPDARLAAARTLAAHARPHALADRAIRTRRGDHPRGPQRDRDLLRGGEHPTRDTACRGLHDEPAALRADALRHAGREPRQRPALRRRTDHRPLRRER
jgi:hypothetical protein